MSAKKARMSRSNGTEISGRKASPPPGLPPVWPEWSDADVNGEKWGDPLPGATEEKKEKGKGKGKDTSPSGKSAKTDKSAASKVSAASSGAHEEEQFEDPFSISLPWSLKTQCTWMRPKHLLAPQVKIMVFSPTSPLLPDLVTKNREIFQSPLIRSIASAVYMLSYIGQTRPFAIEWQSPSYQPNTEDMPWKPWHHIYSLTKAGKGQEHNPMANTLGKYIVRLYWLGCWRKIIVDDRYPVDSTGRWLLPVSDMGSNDKQFELWPMLLTKALLKIASLTWTDKQEIVDFDVVTCLTGWAVQKIFTKGMDMQDIWEVCCGYSDHYTWDQRLILGPFEEPPKADASSKKSDKSSKKDSKKDKSDKSDKKGAPVPSTPIQRSFHLTATCTDLRSLEENSIEDITPCYQHDFLIEDTRNIPIINRIPEYDRNIPAWKEYRWVDWAVANGFWDRVYDWEIFKCMRMVSSMRKVDDCQVYGLETSHREKLIKHSVGVIDEFVERKKLGKLAGAGAGKGKKEAGGKKEGKSKGSSAAGKAIKQVFVDTSIWNDFSKLAPYITCISVYLKPSSFKMNYVISDIFFSAASTGNQKKPVKKDDKKGKIAGSGDENSIKYIYLENVVMKSRNEPIYLFTDSIDFKLTMFSLAHLGNDPPKPDEKKRLSENRIDCKKLVCKLNKCDKGCICQNISSFEIIPEEIFVDTRKYAHVIVEDYQWKSRSIGEQPVFLKTCGYSSVLLDIEKGRHVKKIWVDGNSPYALFIFCDTDTKIGTIDEILDSMMEESEMVMQTCFDICAAFGNLVRYFGFPEYPLALRQFYKSYMPGVNLNKRQMSLFHDSFQEELIKVLANIYPFEKYCDVSRAFRILLLNPNFRIPYTVGSDLPLERVDSTQCPCYDIDGMKLREKSAIKIQSFFKMIYMKKLKSLQNPYDKKFQPVVDVLKLIYQNIFSTKARSINIDLLRGLAINKNLQSLNQYFPFYRDLHSVIVLKQFSGEVNDIPEYSWVPLVRRQFFLHTSDAIFIRAYIFCSLSQYMLRIFNNDTGKEIERYTNNALGCMYEKNEKGYTILAYGWTNENPIKSIHWKLYVVIDKIFSTCQVEMENVRNVITQTKGYFVPNRDGLIIKCRLKIQESCLGTFYFETSSPTAIIKIQLLNTSEEILFEATGTSNVLIPVVNLSRPEALAQSSEESNMRTSVLKSRASKVRDGRKSLKIKRSERKSLSSSPKRTLLKFSMLHEQDGETEFFLQAFVMENTWPLTTKEWEVVERLRTRTSIESELGLGTEYSVSVKKSLTTESKRSILSAGKRLKGYSSITLSGNEKPFWVLTSFNDTDYYSTVSIDDRRIEQIKSIKRNIFACDVNRYLYAQELRNKFLQEHYIKWTPEQSLDNLEQKDFSSQYNTLSETFSKSLEMNVNSKMSMKSKSQISQTNSLEFRSTCPECNRPQRLQDFLYLKRPESVHKMLPPFEINQYDKTRDKYRWLVLPEDEEKIFKEIDERVDIWEEKYNDYLTEMDEYLEKNKSKHEFLLKWYKDIRQCSNDIMEDNSKKREEFIIKMKAKEKESKKKK